MPKLNYDDFDLHIWKEGDRCMAEVTASPAGASERAVVVWPFGNEPNEVILLRLENAVLKGRGYRALVSPEEKILREFGTDVFGAVFRDTAAVADKFRISLEMTRKKDFGLRLNLRLDPPELAMLPWEYVFDDSHQTSDYVCLKPRSPVIRYLGRSAGPKSITVDGPLRVLGMIANPRGEWPEIDAEAEKRRIDDMLAEAQAPDEDGGVRSPIHFRWVRGGTQDNLFDLMQSGNWHVFHFIGHGGTQRYVDERGVYRSEGFVVMEDGVGGAVQVSGSELGTTLEDGNVSLAVLNCCESGKGGGFSSVGATLVKASVPTAIAMQFPITDKAATRFSTSFYRSLTAGQPIEQALTAARRFVRFNSNVEWGIPVLFSREGSCVHFAFSHKAGVQALEIPSSPVPLDAPALLSPAREELKRLWERRS